MLATLQMRQGRFIDALEMTKAEATKHPDDAKRLFLYGIANAHASYHVAGMEKALANELPEMTMATTSAAHPLMQLFLSAEQYRIGELNLADQTLQSAIDELERLGALENTVNMGRPPEDLALLEELLANKAFRRPRTTDRYSLKEFIESTFRAYQAYEEELDDPY